MIQARYSIYIVILSEYNTITVNFLGELIMAKKSFLKSYGFIIFMLLGIVCG